MNDWDGRGDLTAAKIDLAGIKTPPRNVLAVYQFRAGPGREQDAAEAWAFELTYFFQRGVGEPPRVKYADGIYTCTGLMTTTHPGDRDITNFNRDEPADLDFVMAPQRCAVLRATHATIGQEFKFDGRDEEKH